MTENFDMMDKPVLSNKAFKYVNMDEIDFQKDILNVLESIAYKGSIDDFFEITRFYGDERIRKAIVQTKCFGPREVNFYCLMFDLKPADFINYKAGRFRAYPEFKDCPDDFYHEHLAG